MAKAIQQKTRRKTSNWVSSATLAAPIVGESFQKLHRFRLLDMRNPIPFPDIERDLYLRIFDPDQVQQR